VLNLGILVSGRGSNMMSILDSIESGKLNAKVAVVISNRANALALERAQERGIRAVFVDPKEFISKCEYEQEIAGILEEASVDLVCLAGYMSVLGQEFVRRFKYRLINIHPSLLPSFPGLHAQKQALDYGVKFTGCTVHFVDEGMDTGPIILQAVVQVHDDDTEESLSNRILREEHRIYTEAISFFEQERLVIEGRRVKILPDGKYEKE
jgi:phosphoribosylglycinamide formyltransferase-1